MWKSRTLKKTLSMLCVLCMLFSMFANGAVAFAADDEAVTEEVAIEQSSDTEASEEKPADEVPAAIVEETSNPALQEDNDTNENEVIAEGSDTDESVSNPSSVDKDEGEPSGTSDENIDEGVDEPAKESSDEPVKESSGEPEAAVVFNSAPIIGDASSSGVMVKVNAPANSFPEGTSVMIKAVSKEDNKVGFDITFIDASGAEVQPANDLGVSVSFSISASSSLLSNDGADTKISVYHKNDDGTVEELKSIMANTAPVEIEITASHFSEYGVVSETMPESEEEEEAVPETRATRSATSTNLSDFLTDVIINAPTDENGNYIINPNSTYEMTLKFSENEGLQFDDESVLTYNFPDGVIINDIGATAFSLTVVDENGTAIVYDNIFEVVDGQLRVRFNQDDPNFDRLKAMPNVNFSISISSSFDQTADEIVFNENIVKDFVYEETSDLGIQKRVVYDMDTDTANYELQICSEGLNENVVIEDHLTGTALIFNQDVVVESNKNGVLSVTPDYTSVENGFRVTIPQTVDGEIITLRYSATVDNTKISSNGTVEQTNNTARVTSDQVPDGKEASANFAGQADFQRVAKRPVGEPVQISENLYEQTWKIRVNEDHKMEMGGASIYDWITTNSRPFMHFNGDGLTVNVTFENGTTETRVVPWSDLAYLWQNSDGIWGWEYVTPDSDGKASYEIICTSLIDTTGALGDLTVVNGAQVYGAYDEGNVTIGPIGESVFGIQKNAVGTTSTESEWEIKVTVPGSGLPEMHVVDDCPKLAYEGETYIDYPQEDSFVIEGLLEGESWRLRTGSDGRSFTITFYKSETQNDANKGLLPSPDGQPRDIVIRYKTTVNQDWLNLAANDGYSSSTLYRHRNYACAWSDSYRTETVNATVIPIKTNLVKSFVERSEVEIDGVTYPVFRYSLALFGPTEDGITIQDSFNTEYLKFYEAAGIQILGGVNYTPTDGNGTISAVDTSDGMDITVSSFPKQSNGSFYPYYQVSYSLIVKDQDALNALNAAAAASQNGINLENTASWDDLQSSRSVNYTYFPYVDKELLTRPTADNGYVAEFQVIINQYAEDLDPTSDVLAIQDVLSSNLRFIPDSLTISPANDSIVVQHDDETNTLTFTEVPDETTFVITYQARVLGSGNVTYSNTVKFGNFEMTVEETAVVDSSGGGTASNPSITIVKRDSESLSTVLAGATFQLFYMEGENMIPVRDSNGQNVTFTTGADGSALIVGHLQNLGWTLWSDRTYCLVETTAPAGYEVNEEPTYFVLTEYPSSQIEYDITGDQLTIKDEPIKVSVPVTKTWVGPVGADAVVVHLLANETDTGKTITLTADGNWTGSFDNLRKFDDAGEEIRYSVEEEPGDNYTPHYSGSAEQGYTITNTNTETIDIPVVKQWVGPVAEEEIVDAVQDIPTRADTVPVSIWVQLLADETPVHIIVLTSDNDYTGVFEGFPRYDSTDGHEIQYSVIELYTPEGYEATVTENPEGGFIITNTITGKVSIPVTKTWIGPAAESVTVELLADGVKIDEAVLNESNSWQYTFPDLDQYNNGTEIIYSIREVRIDGYSAEITGNVNDGFLVTNTNTETIDIPVVKKWIGPVAEQEIILQSVQRSSTRGDTMPVTLVIQLLADGTPVDTMYLSDQDDYSGVFEGMPKYSSVDGHEIVYTIIEVNVPDGYEVEISENPEGGFIITNTNTETIEIPVVKQWVGPAAESVTINLLADGEVTAEVVLNAENEWQHTFTELPKYDSTDGHEIVYDVQEVPVPGYEQGRSGSAETGFTFTNTITGKVSIPVTKTWIGPASESVTVELLADGVKVDEAELSESNNWQHTFTDLDQYNNGVEIAYTIQEISIDGYATEITGDQSGYTITNTNMATINIPVRKVWIGPAAESVTIRLFSDGREIETVLLTEDNSWKHEFTDLPKYDAEDGHEISYAVQEDILPGYDPHVEVTYDPHAEGTIKEVIFTNTNTESLDIPVEKKWIGPAAESVTIELLADGSKVSEATLDEAGGWQYTFTSLPKYDSNDGHEISYSIAELDLAGYDSVVAGSVDDGFVITNTNTETIEIQIAKQWVGPALESVTINLLADGEVADTVVLNAENEWKYTFADLLKYDGTDGHEIVYDVQEVPVEGYEQGRSGSVETGFTFTNTITGKVSLPVTKTWIGPAAESVTVELLADGVKVAEAILNEANGWQYTFTDFDQYNNGVEIVYTIREVSIDGYSTEITGDQSGYTITNTNTETIEIPVVKQWVGPAATSVTINLLADGEVADTVVLNAENEWKHTFTGLKKYDSTDGHEIEYDVQEVPVEGYEQGRSGSVETGFTFTNTITGKVSVPVTKEWIGTAADSVTVELLADGVKVAETVLNKSNNWQHTFTDLDQYNNGEEISYTIREVSIDGYTTEITGDQSGYTIINTITGKVSIPVTKKWIGPATENVTVELLADGVKVDEAVLNKANGWNHTFNNLDKYKDGVEIVYTIREVNIDGYSSNITGNMSDGFVVTNTNTQTINIPVEKRWVGTAANSVTIRLYADGVKIADVVLNKSNSWKHTFTNLTKYDSADGHEIVYTITEDAVSGYTTSISGDMHTGFVVTNTKTTTPPPTDTPKTGDESHLMLYFLAMILSGIGLIGTLVFERKRAKRQKS